MISLRSSSRNRSASRAVRRAAALLLLAAAMAGAGALCAAPLPMTATGLQPIAVLPLDNLSGHPGDLIPLHDALRGALEDRGLTLLEDATLEAFLEKHRIRWTGGMTAEDSQALLLETGARSVLVTTLVAEDPTYPQRLATARGCVTP